MRILDLINMEKATAGNFVHLNTDNDVQRPVTNLFKATVIVTQSNDPFWGYRRCMLLLALIFYLGQWCLAR